MTPEQKKNNRRLGLILATVALVFLPVSWHGLFCLPRLEGT